MCYAGRNKEVPDASPVPDCRAGRSNLRHRCFAHTADAGAHAVRIGDLAALGAAMDRAQAAYTVAAQALPALAAPQLVATCARLRDEHGALGAKFSGAGGDRSIVALGVDEDHASRLRAGMEAAGLTAWALRVDRV